MADKWFKKEKKKMRYNLGGNKTEIDFVLVLERCQSDFLGTATQVSGC